MTNVATKTPKAASSKAATASEKKSFRRKMTGRVVKDKMNKTVVVECTNARRDPLYGKYVRTKTRFKAHDETNLYKVGDQVEIQEHRPMSRDKRFIVTKLLKKFVEE
jgi:small subunit ribosomal protein S17